MLISYIYTYNKVLELLSELSKDIVACPKTCVACRVLPKPWFRHISMHRWYGTCASKMSSKRYTLGMQMYAVYPSLKYGNGQLEYGLPGGHCLLPCLLEKSLHKLVHGYTDY